MKKRIVRGFVVTGNATRPKRLNAKPHSTYLEPAEFDALIEDQGSWVRITPAIVCPNQSDIAGTDHVLDCQLCYGDGTIDLKEESVECWAGMGGLDLKRQFEVQGAYDLKDARVILPSHVRVYYWYKIEVLDFSSTFNELIKRTTDDFDRTRYPPVADTSDVPFLLVDRTGFRYIRDEHYKVEDDGIRWIDDAKQPIVDTLFSISYPILPTFRVIEMLNENRYYYFGNKQKEKLPIQLPQQALVRWDYLARRSGQNVEPDT